MCEFVYSLSQEIKDEERGGNTSEVSLLVGPGGVPQWGASQPPSLRGARIAQEGRPKRRSGNLEAAQ